MNEFAEALQVRPGLTAIIGGGGKTTLLYRLARELEGRGSVIVTTSTHIFRPADLPFALTVGKVSGILCVGTPCENGKLSAPRQSLRELTALAAHVLVEADGSAGRPVKAHASHEPVIPCEANQVICVVGASGLNRPAAEKVHRPERFTALSGSDTASPEAVAAVLNKEALHTRVFINQADSPERITAAYELARLLDCPVVIASLQKGELLCVS